MFVVLVLQIFANTMVMRNTLRGSLTPCPWFCTGNVERTRERGRGPVLPASSSPTANRGA